MAEDRAIDREAPTLVECPKCDEDGMIALPDGARGVCDLCFGKGMVSVEDAAKWRTHRTLPPPPPSKN